MIYIHPAAATKPATIAKLEKQTGLRAQLHKNCAVLVPKTVLSFAITKPPEHYQQSWAKLPINTGGAA